MLRTKRLLQMVATASLVVPQLAGAEPSAHEISDRNGDGVVDRREFQDRMVDVFFFLDADGNGRLAASEVDGVTPEAFAAADRDGDGSLELSEFLAARSRDFDGADRNGDGALDATESTNGP